MKGKGRNRKTVIASAAVLAALLAVASNASASVLYDTTWMTNKQTYNNSLHSFIGMSGASMHDTNVADDFFVPKGPGFNITSVVGDFIAPSAWGGQGVLVEFFADLGGTPSNTASAQYFATGSSLSVSSFNNHLNTWTGMRFTVDLSSAGITLGSGTWWLSIVPVHEGAGSQQYAWVRDTTFQSGGGVHVRAGAEAHGNNYSSSWGWSDWVLYSSIGPSFLFPPGDMAMSIHGTVIPAPGAVALLAIGGFFGLRPRRRR